ncbi:MAG TPA: hypothetical protein G4N92_02595, partial [Anaerolineae bacterium]|nr:hypothetical protein [Anaerolineae bacterium]
KWSDGVPLTAADSVYSFQLASDPATPVVKRTSDQVASYQALDALTVQMVSKPGLVTDMFEKYFWTPLPQHVWGKYTAKELLTAEISTRTPLGWGAYVIEEWIPGEAIHLKKNSYYFRADEGLPYIKDVKFIFTRGEEPDDNRKAIEMGACDIVDSTVKLNEFLGNWMRNGNKNQLHKAFIEQDNLIELLALRIGNKRNRNIEQPNTNLRFNFFSDKDIRKAISYCIDQEELIQNFLYDYSAIPLSIYPPKHPQYQEVIHIPEHDLEKGNDLLQKSGWVDNDNNPETPRTSRNVPGIPDNTQLEITYIALKGDSEFNIANYLMNSLEQCGIKVKLKTIPIYEFFSPNQNGALFGQYYDIAQLSLSLSPRALCQYFSNPYVESNRKEITEQINLLNFTGFSNDNLDSLCKELVSNNKLYKEDDEIIENIQKIISEEIPIIPLFYHLKVSLTQYPICGFTLDLSARSDLWNIEEFYFGKNCRNEEQLIIE